MALMAKRAASVPPTMAQVGEKGELSVATPVWFSFTEIAEAAAPAPPVGPVITGSFTSVTVTATLWVAVFPLAVVARICRS